MLEGGSFKRATPDQMEIDCCFICQDALSEEHGASSAGVLPNVHFRTVVYPKDCDKPHLLHSRCAITLIEKADRSNPLPCPVCQRHITRLDESLVFLDSLKDLEKKKPVCDQFQHNISSVLEEVNTLGYKPAMLPLLSAQVRQATRVADITSELKSVLTDAHWLLSGIYMERAKQLTSEVDIVQAISSLKFCQSQSQKEEIAERMAKAKLIQLGFFLEMARRHPELAESKLKQLKTDPDFAEESTLLNVREKISELVYLRAFSDSKKHGVENLASERISDLVALSESGHEAARTLLAENYYRRAEQLIMFLPLASIHQPSDILNKVKFAQDYAPEAIKRKASRLKATAFPAFLAKARELLTIIHLNQSNLSSAFDYLNIVSKEGSGGAKTEADELLTQHVALFKEHRLLPDTAA